MYHTVIEKYLGTMHSGDKAMYHTVIEKYLETMQVLIHFTD